MTNTDSDAKANPRKSRGGYRQNAGRKSRWNHGDTCTIRVPKPLASIVMELARRLDRGEEIDSEKKSDSSIDFVPESIDLTNCCNHQQGEKAEFDTEIKSNSSPVDLVTESKLVNDIVTKSNRVLPSHHYLTPTDQFDNDTISNCWDFDIVTQSEQQATHEKNSPSIPELSEAITTAKTILKAKKSARKSLARLLSALYGIPIREDDLK